MSVFTDGHSFIETEAKSRVRRGYGWVSNCQTCGIAGFLTAKGWKHKSVSAARRRYLEEVSK